MKHFLSVIIMLAFATNTIAQSKEDSRIYKSNYKLDIPLVVAGAGLTVYGFYRQGQKDKVSEVKLAELRLKRDDINGFDRWATKNYSSSSADISDIPFYASFGYGLTMLLDKKARNEGANIAVMYLEALLLSSTTYATTSGNIDRFRPYTYDTKAPLDDRTSRHARNSFLGGHPGAVASSTVFMAKVYNDLHPDSKFRHVMWGFAGVATLGTAYLRLDAGKHFPSDLVAGVAISSTIGYLVPHLHKKDRKGTKLSVIPFSGEIHGLSLRLKL